MFRQKLFSRNLEECIKRHFNKTSLQASVNSSLRHSDFQVLRNRTDLTKFKGIRKPFLLNPEVHDGGINKNHFSKFSNAKCWKCNQYLEDKKFTCSECGVLQYPNPNINYFQLFGVSQTFNVNLEELSTKFKNLQKAFHPDKFVNKSKEELEISEMYSRLVNKAYSTLKDPIARGFYILELQKVPVDCNFPLNQEFLIEIMEKNEQLDNITSENNLKKFSTLNSEEVERELALLANAFCQNKWNDAVQYLMKLKYFINLDSKIKKKEEDFASSGKS